MVCGDGDGDECVVNDVMLLLFLLLHSSVVDDNVSFPPYDPCTVECYCIVEV